MVRLPPTQPAPKTIDAALALVRRGLPMLQAKRAIEACLEHGETRVHLPSVEDHTMLRDDLAQAGFSITFIEVGSPEGRQIEIAGR